MGHGIKVNGERFVLEGETSVLGLTLILNLKMENVLVLLNGRLVLKEDWGCCKLDNGDCVEFISLVSGG